MTSQRTAARAGGTRFKFIGDTIAELKKVIWLSRREAAYLTGLVLLISIIAGVVLGLVDFGFAQLINGLFLGR